MSGRGLVGRRCCAAEALPEVSRQLREIGLHEGHFMRLAPAEQHHLPVRDARLALNTRLAQLILVQQLASFSPLHYIPNMVTPPFQSDKTRSRPHLRELESSHHSSHFCQLKR
jgi:Fe2+ transport system protein FeoA